VELFPRGDIPWLRIEGKSTWGESYSLQRERRKTIPELYSKDV
jgi:hypothetical protein